MRFVTILLTLTIVFFLFSCSPSDEDFISTRVVEGVEKTMMAKTEIIISPKVIDVQEDSSYNEQNTPTPTKVPTLTNAPTLTNTPTPTFTAIAEPIFDSSPQTIDDYILDSWDNEVFKFPIVTLREITIKEMIGNDIAGDGNVLVKVDLTMKNPGESVAGLGSQHFVLLDGKGVTHDNEFTNLDCELEREVDVFPGGILDGCIVYEMPNTDSFVLFYAPYKSNRFSEDRALFWEVNYSSINNDFTVSLIKNDEKPSDFSVEKIYVYGDYVLGMLKNVSDEPLTEINVKITAYNDRGNKIESDEGVIWMDRVFPGKKTPFYANFRNDTSKYSKLEVIAQGIKLDTYMTEISYNDFEIENFSLGAKDGIWYDTTGNIKNTGDLDGKWVNILIVGYNSKGEMIGLGQALAGWDDHIEVGEIQPMEDGSFRFGAPFLANDLDHFEFFMEGLIK